VNQGIYAVAFAQAGVAFLNEIAGLALASRFLKISVRSLWRSVWPSIAAAALMALPLIAVERLIHGYWPAIVVGGLLGSAVYLGAIALIAPDSLRYLRAKMLPGRPPLPLEADAVAPAAGERIA
jgi:hypothetical protein